MSDLSDFKRLVYEPEVERLTARLEEMSLAEEHLMAALERAERELESVRVIQSPDPVAHWSALCERLNAAEARAQKAEAELAAMIAIISDAFLAAKAALDEPPTEQAP